MIESGPSLSHMNQFALLVIQSEHNRSKVFAASLGLGVSPDHAVHRLGNFDLQPVLSEALFVETVAALGQDPVQSLLHGGGKKRSALREVIGVPNRAIVHVGDLRQGNLSLLQWHAAEIVSVQIEKVERVVKHRNVRAR